MRRKFRQTKKVIQKEKEENLKKGIFIDLLPLSKEDREQAELVFRNKEKAEKKGITFGHAVKTEASENKLKRKLEIKSSSIFNQPSNGIERNTRLKVMEKIRTKKIDSSLLQAQARKKLKLF